MKKLTILLVFSLFSCTKKGDITEQPLDFITIHGKTYKLMNVIPCNDCAGIWIMYPKDSLDTVPQSINYKSGKTNKTIIKVD